MYYFFIIIDKYMSCFLYDYFRQHPEPPLSHSASQWQHLEIIEIALVLMEIDLALKTDTPKKL
jgi:hypothetical protein